MKARISLVNIETTLERTEKKDSVANDWLYTGVFTSDVIGRCGNKIRILYDFPLLNNPGDEIDVIAGRPIMKDKFDILQRFKGSDAFYLAEISALQERDVFENLKIEEVTQNPFWRALARGRQELLDSYMGASVLEVQRANRLGISGIMGIYTGKMDDGEIRPLVMHGATYGNNAIVKACSLSKERIFMEKYANLNSQHNIILMERHLPEIKLDVEKWTSHAKYVPTAGAICVGLRRINALLNQRK